MKKIILAFALFTSLSSFALTKDEEAKFRHQIADMTLGEKINLAGWNIASITLSCPGGVALTALSGALDTIPWLSKWPDGYFGREEGSLWGGAISLIQDFFQTPRDFADGNIIDCEGEEIDCYDDYTEAFQHFRAAYESTKYTAQAAFGESGYCVDQFERLGIILGY